MIGDAIAGIWRDIGGAPAAVGAVHATGSGTGVPSSFEVGIAAQASIAVAALAACKRYRAHTGQRQTIAIDRIAAVIECRSERYARLDGQATPELWDAIAGAYRCGDGRFVRLHTNFPHHRSGVLSLLQCGYDRAEVAAALQRWTAADFEHAATERGLVVAMLRSFAEWDDHPQSAAVGGRPLIETTRIGDGPARATSPSTRPLDDLRVLEMTRIIAGPIAGRTLAAHGCDVLHVIGRDVPTIAALDIDTGRGKRSAHVDLKTADGAARHRELAASADIVLQSYRPGALAAHGLSPATLAELAPGVVVGSLSAYGRDGPWADKRGFDSLVQTATGFNAAEAAAAGRDQPTPLPMQILAHASGHLLAAGLIVARMRQEQQGGSWHVEVSLARTAHWLRGRGRARDGLSTPEPTADTIAACLETQASGYGAGGAAGRLTAVRHAARLSSTPASWPRASVPYGHDPAAWPSTR